MLKSWARITFFIVVFFMQACSTEEPIVLVCTFQTTPESNKDIYSFALYPSSNRAIMELDITNATQEGKLITEESNYVIDFQGASANINRYSGYVIFRLGDNALIQRGVCHLAKKI
ncbi:hypothetical protein [Fluoribacter dumoffii]|uniref:Lipoprotein n=1 Tax=Fluoribacter dumoffii TaxID=463 RepID=A0A377IUD0_9GAMM|nr:hypothetical protein [Fluoribacter dumoffii]STO91738.1 Uncharacterised protein [Fluoribacter dumoffii]